MKLSEEQAEAIARLRGNSDFQKVMEALNTYRHELLEFVMFAPEASAMTYRGMARSTTEVLRALGSAPETLNKMRARR